MKERRYVKFKVDIYDDTKTKIIDQKPERDFIHYFFARSIVLAGKSDCEGKLYMAKDIPYTIETLAIEFSRDAALVKLALDVLIELKMIEVTEDNIYKVKSFAKHQNIKVEEKVEFEEKEVNVKKIEAVAKEVITNEAFDKEEKQLKDEDKEKEAKNNIAENEGTSMKNYDKKELEINSSEINKENNMSTKISDNIPQNNIPISFEKNKKTLTKKKKEEVINVIDEEEEYEELLTIRDGEFVLGEGERIIASWTF